MTAGIPLQQREEITLECGEKRYFRTATPAKGDQLWCFRCQAMQDVIRSPRQYGQYYYSEDKEMGKKDQARRDQRQLETSRVRGETSDNSVAKQLREVGREVDKHDSSDDTSGTGDTP